MSYDNRKPGIPKSGDVLIVNQSSPIDIMILTYLYPSAIFTSCDSEMLFETQSALSAFMARFNCKRVRKGCTINDLLSDRSRFQDRVIVVFPECTTSNNRGLLAFCPLMLDRAFVMSIKYNNPAYLSTPIPKTYWSFLWALASLLSHSCRLKGSSQQLELDFAGAIARFARVPKTNLGIDQKEEFLEAWARR